MKKIAAAVLGLSGLLLAGCFDIEQTLTLEKNMSGKAGYAMKLDMKPMVAFMAGMKRQMEGKEGPPTAEEIAAVEQDMLASSKAQRKIPSKEEIAKNLPKGVTLLDTKIQDDGLKFGICAQIIVTVVEGTHINRASHVAFADLDQFVGVVPALLSTRINRAGIAQHGIAEPE